MEPSPFLPQTTIAMEKVKIAANAAQPIWKIIIVHLLLLILKEKLITQKFNLVNRIRLKNNKSGTISIKP